MKKLLYTAMILIFLCSCGKQDNRSASFVHACALDETEKGVRFSVLMEMQDGEQNEYSCVSFEGKTPEEAFVKFKEDYSSCYTGSAQLCFLSETLSRRTLYNALLYMCETPAFPSKSKAVSVSSVPSSVFLENIKDKQALDKIKNTCKNESPLLSSFFALCTNQENTAKLCSFTLEDKEIKHLPPVYYKNCAVMQSHHFAKEAK